MTKGQHNALIVRREESVRTMGKDYLVALLLLLIVPTIYNGPRVLTLTAVSAAACMLGEIICCLAAHRDISIYDLFPITTGMTIAMLLPASAPFWLAAAASLFASVIARGPFGGTGHTPFHPAAAGIAFVTFCWPDLVFSYPDLSSGQKLPIFGDCSEFPTVLSPDAALKQGLKPEILPLDLLWGQFAGPMGTTATLVICACGLYLTLKKTIDARIPLCFVGSAAVYAALFPRIMTTPLTSVKYELLCGSLLFCAVFLAADSVTAPRTGPGKILYGILGGILAMLIRSYGAYEQGACFAILLLNAFSPVTDRLVLSVRERLMERAAHRAGLPDGKGGGV